MSSFDLAEIDSRPHTDKVNVCARVGMRVLDPALNLALIVDVTWLRHHLHGLSILINPEATDVAIARDDEIEPAAFTSFALDVVASICAALRDGGGLIISIPCGNAATGDCEFPITGPLAVEFRQSRAVRGRLRRVLEGVAAEGVPGIAEAGLGVFVDDGFGWQPGHTLTHDHPVSTEEYELI
jgi:hypothetical protein